MLLIYFFKSINNYFLISINNYFLISQKFHHDFLKGFYCYHLEKPTTLTSWVTRPKRYCLTSLQYHNQPLEKLLTKFHFSSYERTIRDLNPWPSPWQGDEHSAVPMVHDERLQAIRPCALPVSLFLEPRWLWNFSLMDSPDFSES